MYSNRNVVSEIRSLNKLLSSDALISDRVILNEALSAKNLIVKQQLDKRTLYSSPTVFAFLPCLQMEPVSIGECCEFTSDIQIAKSIETLPKIIEGAYGLAIQMCSGIDGLIKFKQISPSRFANLVQLNLQVNNIYFWIQNNHLYISNPNTKAVNFSAAFAEVIPNNLLYPGEDCDCKTPPQIENLCANYLDQPFYAPANRVFDIKQIVYKSLMEVYFKLSIQKTSGFTDEQSKP